MIKELNDAINYNYCSDTYSVTELKKTIDELENLDLERYKNKKLKTLTKDLKYYEDELKDDMKRVKDSNSFCEEFLQTFNIKEGK